MVWPCVSSARAADRHRSASRCEARCSRPPPRRDRRRRPARSRGRCRRRSRMPMIEMGLATRSSWPSLIQPPPARCTAAPMRGDLAGIVEVEQRQAAAMSAAVVRLADDQRGLPVELLAELRVGQRPFAGCRSRARRASRRCAPSDSVTAMSTEASWTGRVGRRLDLVAERDDRRIAHHLVGEGGRRAVAAQQRRGRGVEDAELAFEAGLRRPSCRSVPAPADGCAARRTRSGSTSSPSSSRSCWQPSIVGWMTMPQAKGL